MLLLATAQARREGCVIERIARDGRCVFGCVEAIQGWTPLSAPGKFEAWLLDNEPKLTDDMYVRVFLGMDDESGTMRITRHTKVESYQTRVQKNLRKLQTEPQK